VGGVCETDGYGSGDGRGVEGVSGGVGFRQEEGTS